MTTDCSSLTESLKEHRLLDESTLTETARDIAPRFDDPKDMVEELVRRGWLTPFQKELLLAGRADELVLGPYVLLEKIGEGGMGAVYKARHRVLKAIRAIKVIRPDRLNGKQAVERFYREAEVVAKLHHPNIVIAHDAGQHGTIHYFVMEFVPGFDLGHLLLQRGRMQVAEACEFVRQAAVGLQHAHERGLIHRDIKPSNLLVTPDGHIKLLDLGLARVRAGEDDAPSGASLTQDGAVMGTPDYMAPEQAEDSHSVDIRADIYSLGCTLYHLLSGRPPFPGGSVMEKLIKHRMDEPTPIESLCPGLPSGLADVVRMMMAKNRTARFQTPNQVAVALEPFCPKSGSQWMFSPDELPGTLMADGIPSNTLVAPPTPNPSGSMDRTESGHYAHATSGSATVPITSPRPVPVGTPRAGEYSKTEFEPQPTPHKRRNNVLVVALVIVAGIGTALGVRFAYPMISASRPAADTGKVAGALPSTESDANTGNTTKPKMEDTRIDPKSGNKGSESESTHPVEPPGGRFSLTDLRPSQGDGGDQSGVRLQGPPIRTGGRTLAWNRRRNLHAFSGTKGRIAAFSADASRAAVVTPTDVVMVYGLRDSQPPTVTSLAELTGSLTDLSAHINAVALAPEGDRVLMATVARSDKPLDGNPITTKFNVILAWVLNGTVDTLYGSRLDGGRPEWRTLAYAPNGKEALAAGTGPQIYRWTLGSRDSRAARQYFKLASDGDFINALTYCANGRLAASAEERTVCVYDANKPARDPVVILEGHPGQVSCVALSNDGRFAVAGGQDGTVSLWEIGADPSTASKKPIRSYSGAGKVPITAVAFAPTGHYFVSGDEQGIICFSDVTKTEPRWIEKPRDPSAILALAFSGDGKNVIVADETGLAEFPAVHERIGHFREEGMGTAADGPPAKSKPGL